MKRPLATVVTAAVAVVGCSTTASEREERPPYPEGGRAEAVWLWEIGQGPSQTARTCGRGANDPIARALCQNPPPTLTGLEDLYRVLRLQNLFEERLLATTTHSLGLAGRIVSAINPRVIVFRTYANPSLSHSLSEDQIDAVAFARGEQFVELIGYDPNTYNFNLYLLTFQQACNATRCAPSDLLTSRIERDWTGWTLYADRDLEDTGLDCLSCHRPDGHGSTKRLLMRQFLNPWMHWSDSPGITASVPCQLDGLTPGPPAVMDIPGEGLKVLTTVEGPGQYAGIPISDLKSASGHDFSSFQAIAGRTILGGEPSLAPPPLYGEPYPLDSHRVICERLYQSDDPFAAWSAYRQPLVDRGFPVPYHSPDVLDPIKRMEALASYREFLSANAATDAFDLAAGLMSDDALRAIGFVPTDTDPPETVLRQMCVRCHSNATPSRLRRARFNAQALEALSADAIAEARRRISLPRTSPQVMPPVRAGELPPDAIQRLDAFLAGR